MKKLDNELIIVSGPTASGKTSYAIKLAQTMNGELINADSRQIYSFLDIATNKGQLTKTDMLIQLSELSQPNHAYELENSGIIGWLFNLINPDQKYSVALFKKHTEEVISNILSRGKTPIIIGGTGLYIDAILKNYPLSLAKEGQNDFADCSLADLQDLMKTQHMLVWNSLNQSDQSNPYRLSRILTKKGKTHTPSEFSRPYLMYYPIYSRENLFDKINSRVVDMFAEGIVAETQNAIAMGYENSLPLNSFGYAEIKNLINGQINQNQCIELIQIKHRQYAKRQITWFEGEGRGYNLTKTNY